MCSLTSYRQTALNGQFRFCEEHATIDPTILTTWVLHRDILHAMTMPVVQLYTQACNLASAALCSQKYEDLELAFRGEARGAFIWLQCFIHEEEDWCFTRGCPGMFCLSFFARHTQHPKLIIAACTTLHSVSTESTIRATLAAALLSSDTSEADQEKESTEPSLPDLSTILSALEHALHNDPFWGPGHYTNILTRSQRLTAGIRDLIVQCEALESLVISAPPSPASGGLDLRRGNTIDAVMPEKDKKNREIKLKKGRMARRQARLREEQTAMIMRMVWQCWSVVNMPATQRLALKAASRKGEFAGRRRTLTSP
jgi:hypothetical protein